MEITSTGERCQRGSRFATLRRSVLPLALHAAAIAIGLTAAFWPTLASSFARLQADPGDTLLNHYVLEHTWLWLTRGDYCGTLWSPPFFHPTPLVLAYSENLLGAAPLYWLVRPFAPPTLAFQLWMMLVLVGTYAGMALALRQLGVGLLLTALGAYLFAFGLPRLVQIEHQQLLPHAFAPWAVLAAWRLAERPSVVALAGLLAASYLQVLASVYLGWFLLLGLALFALTATLTDRGTLRRLTGFVRARWWAVLLLVVAWAALLASLFAPYQAANRDFHRSYREVRDWLPRPASWLAPAPQSAWHGLTCEEPTAELQLFPGLVPLALVVAAAATLARRRDHPRAAAALLTATLLGLLALRWGEWSAWLAVYRWVPGAAGMRAVGRVGSTATLFALPAALVVLDRRLRAAGSRGTGLAAVLLALGVAEQLPVRPLPSFEIAPWAARVERLRARFPAHAEVYVQLPPGRPFWQVHLEAMWAGQLANVPVVNGYSGRYPAGYPDWTRTMTADELNAWLGDELMQTVRVVPND